MVKGLAEYVRDRVLRPGQAVREQIDGRTVEVRVLDDEPTAAAPTKRAALPVRLPAPYPDEDTLVNDDPYLPVPMQPAGSILVRFVDGGVRQPPVWEAE